MENWRIILFFTSTLLIVLAIISAWVKSIMWSEFKKNKQISDSIEIAKFHTDIGGIIHTIRIINRKNKTEKIKQKE